jgi:ParB-like nuclease domain
MSPTEDQRPEFTYLSPEKLRFDPTNPRFGGAGRHKKQDEIQAILEHAPHFARELVDSFLENGFIDYEPLVVRREEDYFVVVEGNRRLAAVRHILANRAEYEQKSTRIADLLEIPVLVFPGASGPQGEKEQRVYLGVRHLFGFREWPAESKAQFLDAHIRTKVDLERTMRELNIKKAEIRRYLVPYRLRKEAKALWEPYRNQDFWVLGEGLSRTGIKEYVQIDVDSESLKINGFNEKKLKNLLHFIYGIPEAGKLTNRLIRETRDLSILSQMLHSKQAAATLEKGRPLDEAALLIESREESLSRLGRLVKDLKLLLRGVLAKSQSEQSENKTLLSRFDAFEQSVKQFIKDAKKSLV